MINAHRRRIRVQGALVHGNEAAVSRVHDVVLEHIVLHVVLHLELTRSRPGRIVFVEGVVDDCAMVGVTALGIVAPDRYTSRIGVIDEVVARGDVAGGAALVFASQLDSEVHVMNDIPLDHHPGASIYVNAI